MSATELVKDKLGGLPWETLMKNMAAEAVPIMGLIEAVAYFLGVVLFIGGIFLAAKAASPAARSDVNKFGWWWSMAIGSLMLALPSTMGTVARTIYGDAPERALLDYAGAAQGAGKLAPLVPILAIIGVIAVMRGLIVMRNVAVFGNYSRGNSTVTRMIVLIISGVLLANLKLTLSVVSSLTGLNLGAGLF